MRPFGGLSPCPASSSKQMRRPGRAPRFYLRPHLGLPHRDRVLVAFHRLADRNLGRPAVPAHQLPGALDGVPDVEQLADQRLDPAQRPALVPGEPVRQRALLQFGLQPGPLLRAQPLPRHRPLRPQCPGPPSCQARCHRRTDPSATRRSSAISLIVSPQANRPAASSRSRSRRCCSAGVYPPRCAYRISPSYARNQPTSPPELYEFNLCKNQAECDSSESGVALAGLWPPQSVTMRFQRPPGDTT